MKKIVLLFFIIFSLSMFFIGCSKSSNTKVDNNPKKENVSNNLDSRSKVTLNLTDEQTNPRGLFNYFDLTREQLINKLGNNYEEIDKEIIYYKELGLTFNFYLGKVHIMGNELFKTDKKLINKIDINGAKEGMTFLQVQEKLGKTEVNKYVQSIKEPHGFVYYIDYNINGHYVVFESLDEEGKDSLLRITK